MDSFANAAAMEKNEYDKLPCSLRPKTTVGPEQMACTMCLQWLPDGDPGCFTIVKNTTNLHMHKPISTFMNKQHILCFGQTPHIVRRACAL